MRKPRWSIFLLSFVGIVACAKLSVLDTLAQSYPIKPIRIVIGYGVGGASDVVARMVAPDLSKNLGQPVVVENRPGATGSLATQMVAKSPADGYTLMVMVASDTILPALRALPYDLRRDLAPVSLLAIGANVLVVHPSVPARNVKELLALARSRPGKLTYGSGGLGGFHHLAGELINSIANVNIVHVPYKGSAQFVIANAAGEVDMSFPSIAAALPLLQAGKVRPLAVTTAKRALLMPSVPTLDESGLGGYDRTPWYGVLAPAAVPRDIIARLNAAIATVVNTVGIKESLHKQGFESQSSTPEQFAALIHREIVQNAKLIKLSGAKAE